MPAGCDDGGQRVLRQLRKGGGQRVCQCLAPLPERRADHPEEQRGILRLDRLVLPQVDAHHGGIHLRRGHEVACRDRKELFRRTVVAERRGDRAVIRTARRGAQPIGNLALHHDRDAVEGVAAFHKAHENRRGDIIRQICDDFESEKEKYDAILKNHSFDDNYKISQMKMKFESYLIEKQSENDNIEILKLRSEYISLSKLIYGECVEVPDDVECLKKEIAEMLLEAQSEKVGEYVAECIDKVMTELGYKVVGNEVLSAQKMTKQHYDYSANSAITVASSENGAMMLEVVGKKKEDGTNGSTSAVKSDMERFCPDFQKIKQGLQQYGISLSDKKLCPPDEKYVRFVDIKKSASADRRITARNRKKRMYNE